MRVLRTILVLLQFISLSVVVFGQVKQGCATKSCRSFHQLLGNKDKEILERLSGTAYVCFLQTKDSFVIASYAEPEDWQWLGAEGTPVAAEGVDALFEQRGTARVALFADGVSVNGETSFDGKWLVTGHRNHKGQVVPRGEANYGSRCAFHGTEPCRMVILGGEFIYSEDFKNQAGTTTSHNLTIRLSTGRFTEEYVFADGTAHQDGGACEIYRQGKLKPGQ